MRTVIEKREKILHLSWANDHEEKDEQTIVIVTLCSVLIKFRFCIVKQKCYRLDEQFFYLAQSLVLELLYCLFITNLIV